MNLYRSLQVISILAKHFMQEEICLKKRIKQSIKRGLFIDQWTAIPLIKLKYMKYMLV